MRKGLVRPIDALLTAIHFVAGNVTREEKMVVINEILEAARKELGWTVYYNLCDAAQAVYTYPDFLDETEQTAKFYLQTEEGQDFYNAFSERLNALSKSHLVKSR